MNIPALLETAWGHVTLATLHGGALIVLIAILQKSLRRRLGSPWTFALWFLVLVRLSFPILPPSSWSWQRAGDALVAHASHWVPETHPVSPAATSLAPLESGRPLTVAASETPLPARIPGRLVNRVPAPPTTMAVQSKPEARWTAQAWLGGLWFLGALGLLVYQGAGVVTFHRRLQRWPRLEDAHLLALAEQCRKELGIRRTVSIRVAPEGSSPCLFGVFTPVVLLPADLVGQLSDSEWRNILRHELGHIRRLDPLWNVWMSLVVAFHWFNPLVWWAVGRMRQDRELACDALVLAQADPAACHAYGETLLKLATCPTSPQPGATVGILENGGPLKSRLQALGMRPQFWRSTALGVLLVGVIAVFALTRRPDSVEAPPPTADRAATGSRAPLPAMTDPVSSSWIEPVSLAGFTDYPQPTLAPGALQRHQDDPAMWSQIPKGDQTFFGVPFAITGLIRLAGLDPQRHNEWYFRPEVPGIPIGKSFSRLYLLHATYYFSEVGTPIAVVRLNYADGTSADLSLRYGEHVLNYWRQRYESTSHLRDPGSRIAWTGDEPSLAEYGNRLRVSLSSLENPQPDKLVETLDFFSTAENSSEVVAGVAVGDPELPSAWQANPYIPDRDTEWQSSLRFQALDAVTGEPIPHMLLRLEVAEPGVHSRIGRYFTDAAGQATLLFPHPHLNYLSIWADREGYAPRLIQWTPKQHGPFPPELIYRAAPGITIQGRVEDEQGLPVEGVLIRINGPQPDFSGDGKEFLTLNHAYAISDAEGRWHCSEIPQELAPDAIQLRVIHPDFLPARGGPLTSTHLEGEEIVTRLSGGMTFANQVLNPDGQPIPGAEILVKSPSLGNQVRGATTDAAGRFSVRLPPAGAPIEILIQAENYAPTYLAPRNPGSPLPTGPIVLGFGRSLEIVVIDESDQPVEGALVRASYSVLEHSLTTDGNGVAQWTHAPTDGQVILQAKRDGFFSTAVLVSPEAQTATLRLIRTQDISGRATDAVTGHPLDYFKVRRGQRDGGEIRWQDQSVAIGRLGQFRLTVEESLDESAVFRLEAPGYIQSEPISGLELSGLTPLTISLRPSPASP